MVDLEGGKTQEHNHLDHMHPDVPTVAVCHLVPQTHHLARSPRSEVLQLARKLVGVLKVFLDILDIIFLHVLLVRVVFRHDFYFLAILVERHEVEV